MNSKKIFSNLLVGIVSALIAVFAYDYIQDKNEGWVDGNNVANKSLQQSEVSNSGDSNKVNFANMPVKFSAEDFDFTYAAENTLHGVVHITSKSVQMNNYSNPIYEWLFGEGYSQPQEVTGFGSGVIISEDGYIVTNYHVIENSDELRVVLNDKRAFDAEIVGTDASTDLALLKIEATDLPIVTMGDSDKLKIGEWVLAVGNPFNLSSTVTAGIVSAKARDIDIMRGQSSIESFIQTDAAVNKGNSGGALVNMKGELVGINSAIASPTGAYSGYAFAIPVNITKKIVADIIKYGEVQRAIMGVNIVEVTAEVAEDYKLDKIEGIYIASVQDGGGAEEAGIRKGDVILAIDDKLVNSNAELMAEIGEHRPGEKVNVLIKRDSKKKQFEVVLRNMHGDTKIVRADELLSDLGVRLKKLDDNQRRRYNLSNGLVVVDLKDGKLKKAGMKEGFIITRVDGNKVHTIDDFKRSFNGANRNVEVEGTYPNSRYMYVITVDLDRD